SAVVCKDVPAWFAAEFLSNVSISVLFVMVILPLFVPRSLSDSIRLFSGRTAASPQSSRNSVPAAPKCAGCSITAACPYEFALAARFPEGAPALAPRWIAASASTIHTEHLGWSWQTGKGTASFVRTRRRG